MRKMRKRVLLISRGAAVIGLASTSQGQNLIVCPGKGQSAEQQNRDRYECHSSAVHESGFDPSQAQPAAPSPYGPTPLRGAMRGATVGAIGGAIGDNAGKGAAIGAGTGGLIGGMRRRNQMAQQYSYIQQQQAVYNRALGACMQARGYTVG